MQEQSIPYKKVILVCGNVHTDGRVSCGLTGGTDLKNLLKAACKERGLPVRVVQTSCLGQCEFGPNVIITPDDVWLSGVRLEDVPAIVERIGSNV